MRYLSSSVEETEAIAAAFAATLSPGDCIALDGEMGAGKTQFVRGLVKGLGGNARSVSSPTYVLLHIYPAMKVQVFHLDAYRVAGSEEMEQIGFRELLEQGGIVVVEWASRVWSLLPDRVQRVNILLINPSQRQIDIEGDGIN